MKKLLAILFATALFFPTPPARGLAVFTDLTTTRTSTATTEMAVGTADRIQIDLTGTGDAFTFTVYVRNVDTPFASRKLAYTFNEADDASLGAIRLGPADFVSIDVPTCTNCTVSATISAYRTGNKIL